MQALYVAQRYYAKELLQSAAIFRPLATYQPALSFGHSARTDSPRKITR